MTADEYVRGDAHTNTAECRFSLMSGGSRDDHFISEVHRPPLSE